MANFNNHRMCKTLIQQALNVSSYIISKLSLCIMIAEEADERNPIPWHKGLSVLVKHFFQLGWVIHILRYVFTAVIQNIDVLFKVKILFLCQFCLNSCLWCWHRVFLWCCKVEHGWQSHTKKLWTQITNRRSKHWRYKVAVFVPNSDKCHVEFIKVLLQAIECHLKVWPALFAEWKEKTYYRF